jgi:threonine/homoserine/homoserine lactone efflux protein
MFDSSFRAFVIVAAALVISPGASMAVVTEMALQRGRFAALLTVVGINIANSSLALASMLGLSAIFHQFPSLLRIVSVGGAIYLTYLGLHALWMKKSTDGTRSPSEKCVATDHCWLNPVRTYPQAHFMPIIFGWFSICGLLMTQIGVFEASSGHFMRT